MKENIEDFKVDTLRPVLCDEISVSGLATKLKMNASLLRSWLKEILGNKSLKTAKSNFIFRKDHLGVYLWYNNKAKSLASPSRPSAIGKTDYETNPEKAELYRGFDMLAQESGERQIVKEQIYFMGPNYFDATAEIIPLCTLKGKQAGVLLLSHIDYRLSEQPFSAVLGLLRQGGAYALIRFDSYNINLSSSHRIKLSRRECEIILYLLVGFSAKEIAIEAGFGQRAVENYISTIKDKFCTSNKKELLNAISDSGLLEKI